MYDIVGIRNIPGFFWAIPKKGYKISWDCNTLWSVEDSGQFQ